MARTDKKSGHPKREPYDPETQAWIDAAETKEERKKRQQRAKYLRHGHKYRVNQSEDREANPEKYVERAAEQRERHHEKISADKLAWERQDRAKYPEKYKAKSKAYYAENKEKVLAKAKSLKGGKVGNVEPILNRVAKVPFHNTSRLDFQKLKGEPDKIAANLTHEDGHYQDAHSGPCPLSLMLHTFAEPQFWQVEHVAVIVWF